MGRQGAIGVLGENAQPIVARFFLRGKECIKLAKVINRLRINDRITGFYHLQGEVVATCINLGPQLTIWSIRIRLDDDIQRRALTSQPFQMLTRLASHTRIQGVFDVFIWRQGRTHRLETDHIQPGDPVDLHRLTGQYLIDDHGVVAASHRFDNRSDGQPEQ